VQQKLDGQLRRESEQLRDRGCGRRDEREARHLHGDSRNFDDE
jgi:hypothetical protein